MKINIKNNSHITIDNDELEEVETFTYLGSIIATDGGTERDVKPRIGKASYAFKSLTNIWKSNKITTKTKIRLFNTNVKSVLFYGAETWKLSKPLIKKLQTFTNKCLRQILKIYWLDRIPNIELWEKTKQEQIEITLRRRTWRWVGHTLRKPNNDITQQALEWNPQGTRRRGRPKETWRRTIQRNLEENGLSWKTVKAEAKNRIKWRCTVDALCSKGSERI